MTDFFEIKAAVDDLGQAFSAFQNANDQRLCELESKQGTDPLTEDKVNRINADVDQLQGKVDRLNASLQRSALETPGLNNSFLVDSLLTEEKEGFSQFLRKGIEDGLSKKSLSASIDPDGGYMVPQYLSEQIVSTLAEVNAMRGLCSVVQIGSEAVDILVDKEDTASAWVQETAARAETASPNVAKVRIPTHELYAEPRITQKLLDDSYFDVDTWLSQKIADTFGKAENAAFINGTGVGQPRGFLTYDAGTSWGQIEQVSTGVDGAWPASNPGDVLIDLHLKLSSAYAQDAAWIMNRTLLADIRKFKATDNSYLWQPTLEAGQPSTLFGYPVFTQEDMPAKATDSRSVAFGNFKAAYTIADRADIRLLRDPYTAKPYVKFYTTKRVGGDVVNFDAIKLLSFSA